MEKKQKRIQYTKYFIRMENNYTEIRIWKVIRLYNEDHSKLYNSCQQKLILVRLITSHTLINISVDGLESKIVNGRGFTSFICIWSLWFCSVSSAISKVFSFSVCFNEFSRSSRAFCSSRMSACSSSTLVSHSDCVERSFRLRRWRSCSISWNQKDEIWRSKCWNNTKRNCEIVWTPWNMQARYRTFTRTQNIEKYLLSFDCWDLHIFFNLSFSMF